VWKGSFVQSVNLSLLCSFRNVFSIFSYDTFHFWDTYDDGENKISVTDVTARGRWKRWALAAVPLYARRYTERWKAPYFPRKSVTVLKRRSTMWRFLMENMKYISCVRPMNYMIAHWMQQWHTSETAHLELCHYCIQCAIQPQAPAKYSLHPLPRLQWFKSNRLLREKFSYRLSIKSTIYQTAI
jgi:hypothetical protein